MNTKNLPAAEMDPVRAVTRDRFRWLSLGFYVKGAMTIFTFSIFLMHFFMLLAFSFIPESEWNGTGQAETETTTEVEKAPDEAKETEVPNEVRFLEEVFAQPGPLPSQKGPPMAFLFRIMAGIVGFIILIGWTVGGLTLYTGRCLAKRRKRTFVLIMAGVNCIAIPYGTLLGIGAILTLSTEDAKEEYGIEPATNSDLT